MKLQASLQGLGPVFRVRVTVKNSGQCARQRLQLQRCLTRAAPGAAVADALVVVTCDAGTHGVNEPIIKVHTASFARFFAGCPLLTKAAAARHACARRRVLEARVHQLQ